MSLADERRVRLVLEAERFFGEKKKRCTFDEMEQLIGVALAHAGVGIADVEGVSLTAYQNEHLPESRRDERWVSRCPVRVLGRPYDALVVNHHLSHAAMVHAFPDATNVVIDVCDGGGDFGETHFTYRLENGHIEALPNAPIHAAFSSRFYDIVSRYLYGRIMSEGKLMALASLGKPRRDMLDFVRANLRTFHAEPPETSLAALSRRYPVSNYLTSSTAHDLAASVQTVFEALRVESVRALPADAPDVLLAGGATLNILANSAVKSALEPGRRLLVRPCCDDTGQSLGALLYDCHEQRGLRLAAEVPFLGYGDRIDDSRLGARVTERTRLSAPGICHYDDSARLQTVDASEDPFLHRLLDCVGELTGCPLLINTSLNSQGAPIFSKLEQTRTFAREHSSLGVRVFHGGSFVA